jgi:hypothetical protein
VTEKIRAWVSGNFICVHVNDGVSKATVSLNAEELRKLYADANKNGSYAFAHKAVAPLATVTD